MDVFSFLVTLLLFALIGWALFWLVGQLPATMQMPARVILVVLFIILLLGVLFGAVHIPIRVS